MTKRFRRALFCVVSCALILPSFAETGIAIEGYPGFAQQNGAVPNALRSHAYKGAVLSFTRIPDGSGFFSSGADGFITLHAQSGDTEGWQISDLPVRKIAVHPDGNLVAAYESDGFSVYRLSVWNWKEKKRLYAKRFRDSVASLSWSAKGTYLLVGNTSMDGITVFESATGNIKNVFRKAPGIVSLGLTGASESSMMTFGPSGTIQYTDISNGAVKASYSAPADVQSPVAFNNNLKIAGIGNDAVVLIDATSGKTISSIPVQGKVVIATSVSDDRPVWLESTPQGTWKIHSGETGSADFSVPDGAEIVSALGNSESIVIGTSAGNIFAIKKADAFSGSPKFEPLARDAHIAIDDITSDGTRAFILAAGSVFISSGPGTAPVFAFSGLDANRIEMYGDTLLCWSTEKNSPLMQVSFDGETKTLLYAPKNSIQNLASKDSTISFVDGKSQVVVIGEENKATPFIYSGAGLQEAIPVAKNKILVSKSATSRVPYPLILIDTATGETVPLKIAGDLCFGMKYSGTERGTISAILVHAGTSPTTEIITMSVDAAAPAMSSAKVEASYPDEDLLASLEISDGIIITNLGKSALTTIDLASKKQRPLERGYALPVKIANMDQFFVSLNSDGSLTWFSRKTLDRIADATATATGYWLEGK